MKGLSTIGDWRVNWDAGWIQNRRSILRRRIFLDSRVLAVFQQLAEQAGQTVSVDDILDQVWSNRVVSRDSVSTAIYQLRQALGDNSQQPTYVKTEGRQGYRLVAPVRSAPNWRGGAMPAIIFALVAITAFGTYSWQSGQKLTHADSLVVVEPLEDLTEADQPVPLHSAIEMTLLDELVNRLPGRVTGQPAGIHSGLTLQPAIVACDLGPVLVVHLIENATSRYLWSQAYRLDEEEYGPEEASLVQEVARDVSQAVSML
ncbi:MAG TPA: winged helix-turn-helix domain-containing protein [Xanthomonadales bacterium]|nr:winged helix-turn-helix domain-containing protein [Xanthomonadales bacterium]